MTIASPAPSTRAVLLLVLMPLLALAPRTAPPSVAAPVVQTRTLDNGLRVVVEERPNSEAVGVSLTVRAGVRDDEPGRGGEVALLARVLAGGTPERPSPGALAEPIRSAGGTWSLSIDADLTHYRAFVPSDELDGALSVLSSMLRRPRLGITDTSSAAIETAGGRYYAFRDDFAQVLWPSHPAGRPSGGTATTRAAITFGDLLTTRERLFGARNIALAIVGPVQAEDVFARTAELFGTLPPGEARPLTTLAPANPDTRRRTLSTTSRQATVYMLFPTPGVLSDDAAPVALLSLLLSGPSGLLFQDVRSGHGLARNVDAFGITFSDVGAYGAYAQVQPGNVDATLTEFEDVFRRLREEPVTEATIAALRERLVGALLLARANASVRADELASTTLIAPGRLNDTVRLTPYATVTPDDMRRAAERYFAPERAVVRVFMPGQAGAAPPASPAPSPPTPSPSPTPVSRTAVQVP